MSTILAHCPNRAVSCVRFLVRTTSGMFRISTSGKARKARRDAIPWRACPATETILYSQSSHEDTHFTFTFPKVDGQPWRPWSAAPSAKRARKNPNPPSASKAVIVGHTVQKYATPAPTPYGYPYPGYAPAFPVPYSLYRHSPSAPSPSYASPGSSVMLGAPPPPATFAPPPPSQYPLYPPPRSTPLP